MLVGALLCYILENVVSIYNVNEMLEMKRYDNNKWRLSGFFYRYVFCFQKSRILYSEVVLLENDIEYDTKHYNWEMVKG